MKPNRRGFLKTLLAAPAVPAVVKMAPKVAAPAEVMFAGGRGSIGKAFSEWITVNEQRLRALAQQPQLPYTK